MNIALDNTMKCAAHIHAFDECNIVFKRFNVERCKGFSPCRQFTKANSKCGIRRRAILHLTNVRGKSNQLRFHHTFATQKMRRKLLAREASLDSLVKTSFGGFHE